MSFSPVNVLITFIHRYHKRKKKQLHYIFQLTSFSNVILILRLESINVADTTLTKPITSLRKSEMRRRNVRV